MRKLEKPKMIFFDYGETLLSEPAFDPLRGTEAVMEYAVKNPQGLTPEQVREFSARLSSGICGKVREIGAELHNLHFQKLLYEYLQIGFSVSPEEQERIFWDGAAPGVKTPDIEVLLDYLYRNNIRTGVISNISFSGNVLKNRIDRLLPGHHFEFIIASSEYMIRKPDPLIFELALRKAGLPAEDVWHCGDLPEYDLAGARGAGIFPVWYRGATTDERCSKYREPKPDFDHIAVDGWNRLIEILEGYK